MNATDNNIPLTLPGTPAVPQGAIIHGRAPVVIMGPNGSGKTRFSSRLAGAPLSRIPALRNISEYSSIPFQPPRIAFDQLSAQAQQQFSNLWMLASDAQQALATILSRDARAATKYRDAARETSTFGTPEDTELTVLLEIWHLLFAGRKLEFEDHQPIITNQNTQPEQRYPAHTMSDGERVALYVATRVLLAPPGILVVDEPELHLHSLLARQLWTLLEKARSDCRFIYITHDINFALSRRDASFVILRSQDDYQVISRQTDLPERVFRDIVGAATLTIASSRTVFCEGTPGRDDALCDALLSRDGYHIVAAGSCAEVQQCVDALRTANIVRGAEAIGIVDRDYWSNERIKALESSHIHVLGVHEIESLYLLKPCFEAVADRLHLTNQGAYAQFLEESQALSSRDLVRVATERAKQRIFAELSRHIAKVPTDSTSTARQGLIEAVASRFTTIDAGTIYDEEYRFVTEAKDASGDHLLAVFPSKPLVGIATRILGVTRERYFDILETIVRTARTNDPVRESLLRALGLLK